MKKLIKLPVLSEWGQIGEPITVDDINILGKAFYDYILNTNIPILKEFTAQQGISFDEFVRVPAFQGLLDLYRNKKEASVERGGLTNTIPASMVKLELIQEGWKDKAVDIVPLEIEQDGEEIMNEIKKMLSGRLVQNGGASIEKDE